MEILAWLVPTGVVAVVMMIWASWAGRPQREEADRSEAAYERFAKAMRREHPGASTGPADGGPRPQHRHRRTPLARGDDDAPSPNSTRRSA